MLAITASLTKEHFTMATRAQSREHIIDTPRIPSLNLYSLLHTLLDFLVWPQSFNLLFKRTEHVIQADQRLLYLPLVLIDGHGHIRIVTGHTLVVNCDRVLETDLLKDFEVL